MCSDRIGISSEKSEYTVTERENKEKSQTEGKKMKQTLEQAIRYATETKATAIMEKEGNFLTAKDWNEVEYAQSHGWNYIGHPADLAK